jgi:aspartate aminotransferase
MSPGDEVIVTAPFMDAYNLCIDIVYGQTVEFAKRFKDGWKIDAAQLETAINSQMRVIFVNSPQDPTDIVYTQECIIELVDVLKWKSEEYGRPTWFVFDCVYARLLAPGAKHARVFSYDEHAFIGHSLSKDLSIPGERIGCAIVKPRFKDAAIVRRAWRYLSEVTGFHSPNRIHQRIATKIINEKITVDLALYRQWQEIVCQRLDECGIQYVKLQGGLFVFPKLPEGIDEDRFRKLLTTKYLIVVLPGEAFHVKGFDRISYLGITVSQTTTGSVPLPILCIPEPTSIELSITPSGMIRLLSRETEIEFICTLMMQIVEETIYSRPDRKQSVMAE